MNDAERFPTVALQYATRQSEKNQKPKSQTESWDFIQFPSETYTQLAASKYGTFNSI